MVNVPIPWLAIGVEKKIKNNNCRSCLVKAYLKQHLVSLEKGRETAKRGRKSSQEEGGAVQRGRKLTEEATWPWASTYRYMNIVMLTWGYCRIKNDGVERVCLCERVRACLHFNKCLKLWSVWSAVPNEDFSRCKNAQLFFPKTPNCVFDIMISSILFIITFVEFVLPVFKITIKPFIEQVVQGVLVWNDPSSTPCLTIRVASIECSCHWQLTFEPTSFLQPKSQHSATKRLFFKLATLIDLQNKMENSVKLHSVSAPNDASPHWLSSVFQDEPPELDELIGEQNKTPQRIKSGRTFSNSWAKSPLRLFLLFCFVLWKIGEKWKIGSLL